MRTTIGSFIRSVFSDWFTAMSGSLSVPLAMGGYFIENRTAHVLLYATSAICLFHACYMTWKKERQKAGEYAETIRDLRKELEAANDCANSISLPTVVLIRDSNNPEAKYVVRATILNHIPKALRFMIDYSDIILSDKSPVFTDRGSRDVVILPGGIRELNFPSFAPGVLPESGRIEGKLSLSMVYGIAGKEYSRTFKRELFLYLNLPMADGIYRFETVAITETDEAITDRTGSSSI